ncbi:right-handed parallel beta-helix repeat-containing protein [Cerasicoccus arenae]|uniref:Right handed beta helix domain-containing protein n=1 Tax=Cerasicoccus arenae TaxID=424488 RepID=A0A8J3GDR7_9BACT|nr:right-handed parallel beta-helix repeat-containing protein [Cerasicoccus arenae]MBK1857946.1 right-handed parallel beta-helix repeat-containing protein [Cerasicoccus arenae]GHB97895.1 hypothetical protein GCM10007047_12270 [Cerasicoccus arenae]
MKKTTFVPAVLLLLSLSALQAADFYMTPSGANSEDGSDWANALPASSIGTTLNTTMGPGDTLFIGSGDYINIGITLDSDGTSGSPKTITGVDTGGGIPHFNGNPSWVRSNPDSGRWQILTVRGDYWVVENLELSHVRYAIRNTNADSATNITFRDITMHDVRHGVYVNYMDNSTFENCVVQEYTKQGFRLDRGCDNVTFTDCYADLTGGDTSWWDYSENFPYGFVVNKGSTINSNITFEYCVAIDNRKNNQLDSDGDPLSYWNGDGFVVEDNTGGITEFIGCLSINNEDGGYDIKSEASFVDCTAVKNYRGFRLWHTTKTLENCVATYPFRRSTGNPSGSDTSSGSGVWTQNGTSTLSNFTFHGNNGRGLDEAGSGGLTATDSIISFSGASGSFTSGSVTLGAGSVTYRPGSGTDPDFVNPSSAWDGSGDDMNSQTYADTKGYFYGTVVAPTASVIAVNLSDSTNTFLAPTDVVGVLPTANWNNSTVNNETITDLVDDTGAATTADVSFVNTPYYYENTTPTYSVPLDDDSKMMRGTRALSNGSATAASFDEIPFAEYDVYVYWGGRKSGETVPAVLQVDYQTDSGGTWVTQDTLYMMDGNHSWDGTYDESTATTSGAAVDGNDYVVFRGQTASSFRIRGNCGRRTGICGIQIVERTEEYVVIGDTIGMNLANTGSTLDPADVAGVIPMPNWNNSTVGNETITNAVNDAGVATTVDFDFVNTAFYYTNATPTYSAPYEADSLLMRGTRGLSNGSSTRVEVDEIPYAVYDVYVYWGGRKTGETVPAEMKIEFQTDSGGTWVTQDTRYMLDTNHSWDGTYDESTAATTGTAVDGNDYVVFRGQTASSFQVKGTCGRRTGFNALQIVEQ